MSSTQICLRCNVEKPLSEYYRHRYGANGYVRRCKQCFRERQTARYHRGKHGAVGSKAEAARVEAIAAAGTGRSKGITISGPLTTAEELARETLQHPTHITRPKTRGECADGPRPCPWVSCRQNLFLDVLGVNGARRIEDGAIRLNMPRLEPGEVPPEWSCALDVADRGGMGLEDIGDAIGVTRERIRQIEMQALAKVRRAKKLIEYQDYASPLDENGSHGALIPRHGSGGAR